jgi:hypothetical protein
VNKLAEELINSGGDPESRAGKRVCELVLEATKLNACISICNPTGERRPPREGSRSLPVLRTFIIECFCIRECQQLSPLQCAQLEVELLKAFAAPINHGMSRRHHVTAFRSEGDPACAPVRVQAYVPSIAIVSRRAAVPRPTASSGGPSWCAPHDGCTARGQ